MKPVESDHRRVDERSLAMHRLVARKLLADPAVLDRARDNLRRWQASDGSPMLAFAELERMLQRPVKRVAQFLAERSERATRLRPSSLVAGALTDAERRAIDESYSARTHHPRRSQR